MSVIKRPQESLDRGLFNHLTSRTAGAASRVAAVAGPVLLVPPHRRGHAKARSVHLRSLPGRVAGQQTAKAGASVEESTAAINQWQQPQRRQDTTHGCQTKHCKAPCAAQVDPCVEELRHCWQQRHRRSSSSSNSSRGWQWCSPGGPSCFAAWGLWRCARGESEELLARPMLF